MTVKELKDFAESIDDKYNNREIVMDGFGPYTHGYNPIGGIDIRGKQVTENFPTNKPDKKTKLVCVLTIS